MKRVNAIVNVDSENSELKKIRFSNGNEGIDFEKKLDKSLNILSSIVSDDLEGPSHGGLNKSNVWDFDINFDLIFADEEEETRKGLPFDLNLPPCNGGPVINGNRLDVIDIASDDSDNDEVEVVGYSYGYNNAKGKEIDLGMPNGRVENSGLDLETIGMYNFFGESSTDGLRGFTRDEKGKSNVVDSWLSSLKANSPTGSYLLIDSDNSNGNDEPMEEEAVGQYEEEAIRVRHNYYRESFKETARRFARVNLPDKNNVNESSPVEQLGKTCGPFSEALRMVRQRVSKKREANQLIEWKPLKENKDKRVKIHFVPSLLDLSLKALAENAEGVVSLELVPDNLRQRLVDSLCDMRKMNEYIMKLLVEGCPTEIRVKNCSWLTEKEFLETIGNCETKDLRVLQLDLCGQCMLDFAFKDIISRSSNSFRSLAILSLRGACRLSDNGIKALITSSPLLRSVNLSQCSLLTSDAINFLADFLGSNLKELYIDDCQKINPIQILPAFKKLGYLEVLSVSGIHSVTDEFIDEVITACGRNIKELDLSDCPKLTDCGIKSIGSTCVDLCSLNISNLPNLTDLGMEYLANGCRSIRKLKMCRNEFSDEAMAAYIESSGEYLTELLLNHVTKVGPNTALSLAKRSRKLSSLDVSFCRRMTNEALGLIVDSCLSLKLLKIFGCRQITDVFLKGHSNPNVRIIGLNLSPMLDHVNLLEHEGVLLRYSPLY